MEQVALLIISLLVLAVLYLLSTPYVSAVLVRSFQYHNPLNPKSDLGNAGAIVILSADYARHAPEFGHQTAGPLSLERIRYGAWLHRKTGLPILIAGGNPGNAEYSSAEVLRMALVDEFRVPVRWVESDSMNTFEHAQNVLGILAADGIEEVLLVTHAWHMPRAVSAFEYFGIEIIPAPTKLRKKPTPILTDFWPEPRWLLDSYYGIYEQLGLLWYQYRYYGRRDTDNLRAGRINSRILVGAERLIKPSKPARPRE